MTGARNFSRLLRGVSARFARAMVAGGSTEEPASDDDDGDDECARKALKPTPGLSKLPAGKAKDPQSKDSGSKAKRTRVAPMNLTESTSLAKVVSLLIRDKTHKGLTPNKLKPESRADLLAILVDSQPTSLADKVRLVKVMSESDDAATFATSKIDLSFLKDPARLEANATNAKRLKSLLTGGRTYEGYPTCTRSVAAATEWLGKPDESDSAWLAFDKVLLRFEHRQKLGRNEPSLHHRHPCLHDRRCRLRDQRQQEQG